MRLVRLTLAGFKSFADRTEFAFEDDITGIVGPNGCGKSNVVDAIKWVLGERSSKSLRGKEMIDVIFAGSAGRKPAGLASVTLTFENPVLADATQRTRIASEQLDEQTSAVAVPDEAASISEPAAESASPEAGENRLGEPAHQDARLASQEDPDLDTADSKVLDASIRGKRTLPVDADIVEVERRLYRDGTSQYLVNNRRARLKDIRDLFLDTGVGADAYSIIEQGKVDAMLLASPQERRVVFEEAAGVARYKQRRIESVRKLERTDQNLVSTREQLDSTERRLRLVKGQATKARRFKELDEEFKALRLAIAFDQYDEIRQRLEGLTSRLAALEHDRTEAGAAVTRFDAARQEGELARAEALDAQRHLEQQRTAASHAGETASQRRAMLERTLADARKRIDADRDQLTRLDTSIADLARQIEEKGSRIGLCAEQLAGSEQVLRHAAEARARVLETLTEQQSALAKRRAQAAEIDRERTRLLASVHADERRLESLRDQAGRASGKAAAIQGEQTQVESAMESLKASTQSRRERITQTDASVRENDALLASLSSGRSALAASLSDLEQRLVRSESRRQTLQEMVDAREGLADAVKLVLDRKAAGEGFAAVLAPLADLVSADAEHAAAIEAALGPDLQALIVEHATTMPGATELEGLVGRVTFLPMTGGPANTRSERAARASVSAHNGSDWPFPTGNPDEAESDAPPAAHTALDPATLLLVGDRLRPLRTLVRPDARFEQHAPHIADLLDRLLGTTHLVADLDTALLLSAGPLAGSRFVTAAGACLEADGRLSAGPLSASQAGGMIQRRAELANLEREVADLRIKATAERASLKAADEEAASLSARRAQSASTLATLQREQIGEQTRLERAVADHARLERDRLALETESAQIAASIGKIDADRAALSAKAESLSRLHEEQTTAAEQLDRDLASLRRKQEEASEQLTAVKIEVGRLGEQLSSARREHHALTGAREDSIRRQRDLVSALEHNGARAAEHERGIAEAAQIVETSSAALASADQELVGVRQRVAEADGAVKSLMERLIGARKHADAIERDWNALETTRREGEVRREALEERTLEEIGLDLGFEYADYRAMMADDTGGMVAALGSHAEQPDDSEVAEDSDASSMAPQSRNHATHEALPTPIRIIPVPRDEGQKRVDTLRAEIKSLGNVNLDSIEEEQTLAARNDDLIKQVADLDAAGKQLRELIDRLNDASRFRFQETFLRVQEEFGGKNGMFRRLFGGGKAEVRLMPLIKEINGEKVETDEVDMLESGVEIIAKPPGKEPRSISQLSGGEKTLTAVSLLMAIFRSKPSCFCILDEVDAALDEGNVTRFCNTIRQYTDFSRFIVITHNKRTMQSADRLYGVTMQERGVSKRVSVRFDQVKDDGSIIAKPDTAQADSARPNTPRHDLPASSLATQDNAETPTSPASTTTSGRRPSPARSRPPVVVTALPQPAPIELPDDDEPLAKPSPSERLRAAVEVAATEAPPAPSVALASTIAPSAISPSTLTAPTTPSPADLAAAEARPIVKPSHRLREALALVKSGSPVQESAPRQQ